MYVCFLNNSPDKIPALPLVQAKEGLEVFMMKNRYVFVLSRIVNGRFGFPNNFIEKEFGVESTERNWTTVTKIAGLLK
jgi:uncharacterized protein (DUF1697 family)